MAAVFTTEADVRQRIKKLAKEAGPDYQPFWIEGKGGSTTGVADLLLGYRGRLHPIELKLAQTRDIVEPGRWHVNLRPSQHRFFRRCESVWVDTFVVVGLAGTSRLFVVHGWQAIAAGQGNFCACDEISTMADLAKMMKA